MLVIDGAMGTAIQALNLGPDDFGGVKYEGCNEYLTLTRPGLIEDIHRSYLDAGADIIETNTFGSTPVVLAEYELAHEARRLNREAATCVCPPRLPVCVCGQTPRLKIINRRVVKPSDEEVQSNPRSRSAKLRAAQRI